MEFLKEALGEEFFNRFEEAVRTYNGRPENGKRKIKLVNLAEGRYVCRDKYNAAAEKKRNLEVQVRTLHETIRNLWRISLDDKCNH